MHDTVPPPGGGGRDVSPCCIGKLRRGPASRWLRVLLELTQPDAAAAEAAFALLAAWADSEHVAAAAPALSVARRGGAASDVPAAEAASAAHLVATAHAVVAAAWRLWVRARAKGDRSPPWCTGQRPRLESSGGSRAR